MCPRFLQTLRGKREAVRGRFLQLRGLDTLAWPYGKPPFISADWISARFVSVLFNFMQLFVFIRRGKGEVPGQ